MNELEMFELEMFGCTKAVLDETYQKILGYKELFIMGMMSDAQHEIECGMHENARQSLNQAKYLLAKLFEEKISG
jgi:hypothetical protein